MKIQSKTKAQCQEIHFRKNFKSRLGVELNKMNYKILCSHIREDRASYKDGTIVKTIDKQSNRLLVKQVLFPLVINKEFIVIWDIKRNRAVTVLPEDVKSVKDIVWEKYYDQVDMIEFGDDNDIDN